eukprot:2644675-Alexandrium_andersonii.AAC.1
MHEPSHPVAATNRFHEVGHSLAERNCGLGWIGHACLRGGAHLLKARLRARPRVGQGRLALGRAEVALVELVGEHPPKPGSEMS